jgi:copper chaperone CopZ
MTCAFAVRGALKKFPGVESVDVSLNKGLAVVKLRPGNTIRPEQFWDAVRKNGFTPKETRVVVRGRVSTSPQLQLTVPGANEVFRLKGNDNVLGKTAKQDGTTVIVEGSLVPDNDLKPSPLDARSVRAAQ